MQSNLAYDDMVWDELIDGEVVAMSPRPSTNHNRIAWNIFRVLDTYLADKPCAPFSDGEDLYLSEKNRFVPDGMIVCDPNKIKIDGVHGAPDLVVEILSPTSENRDRGKKKTAYEKAGVREYWIVNPSSKTVEIYVLREGQLAFDGAYSVVPDFMLAKMTEEERAAVSTEFRCRLFDDLVVPLKDVFFRTIKTE